MHSLRAGSRVLAGDASDEAARETRETSEASGEGFRVLVGYHMQDYFHPLFNFL